MPAQITMPQLSDTMSEGTLVKWIKAEGDAVVAGQEIAEVETDKATMPMEAYEGGTLAAILVQPGAKVKVGTVLAVIATAGEVLSQIKKQARELATVESPSAGISSAQGASSHNVEIGPRPLAHGRAASCRELVGAEALQTGEQLARRAAETLAQHAPQTTNQHMTIQQAHTLVETGDSNGHLARVSPLARRVARERGIDPSRLRGTGPSGRVIKRDVEQALASSQRPSPVVRHVPEATQPASAKRALVPVSQPAGAKQVIPLSKMRLTIATRLQQSKQTIPHFYEMVDVDCEPMLALRQRLNDLLEKEGVRLSLADFLHRGVAVALGRHPALNSTFNDTEITQHAEVNLGMAVALEQGLIVPVLRGANHLGLRELRVRTADLVDRALATRLRQEELSGGTFTVSNLGTYDIREFTAIINPPEVAILAVGAASKRPAVVDDQIVPRTVMTLTLSADHRVVDGATAAEFLHTLRSLLEEPGMMLL